MKQCESIYYENNDNVDEKCEDLGKNDLFTKAKNKIKTKLKFYIHLKEQSQLSPMQKMKSTNFFPQKLKLHPSKTPFYINELIKSENIQVMRRKSVLNNTTNKLRFPFTLNNKRNRYLYQLKKLVDNEDSSHQPFRIEQDIDIPSIQKQNINIKGCKIPKIYSKRNNVLNFLHSNIGCDNYNKNIFNSYMSKSNNSKIKIMCNRTYDNFKYNNRNNGTDINIYSKMLTFKNIIINKVLENHKTPNISPVHHRFDKFPIK